MLVSVINVVFLSPHSFVLLKKLQILKLLQGDEEITTWARQQIDETDELDASDGEPLPTNIQSHLNLALLGLEDDSLSVGSGIQSISIEDYLQGRCSRSSSFN